MGGWVRNLDLHSDLGSACLPPGNKSPHWVRRPCSRLGDREGAAPGTQEWVGRLSLGVEEPLLG